MSQCDMAAEAHGHGVIVIHQESGWVGAVAPWLADGIRAGLRAVAVVTPEHEAMLRQGLTDVGVDSSAAEASGRYQYLDVQAAASAFVDDGVFDSDAFRGVVRSILEGPAPATRAGSKGAALVASAPSGIRMVGEVAALLVSHGEERAALDIERLCREMTSSQPVSLQCVYAADVLSPTDLGLVRQVFDLHTTVAVEGAGAALSTPGAVLARQEDHRVELFPGVPQSIAKVRRFVTDTLDRHHPLGVVLDCSLIASEMATNAYRHADGSPFRVGVRLVPGRVRITVEDTSITPPSMPHPLEHDEGGRGVAIIDALSDRWGADSLPSGKVVWAEVLTASRSLAASEAQRA
ncbi:MAG: MEDS domain-containing protein [Terracoccus sp.]